MVTCMNHVKIVWYVLIVAYLWELSSLQICNIFSTITDSLHLSL